MKHMERNLQASHQVQVSFRECSRCAILQGVHGCIMLALQCGMSSEMLRCAVLCSSCETLKQM